MTEKINPKSTENNMNGKQIVGLIGSVIAIIGCFMPIATFPVVGGINYMFPPDGGIGDGVIVAALVTLGLLGAVRGGSILMFLCTTLAGIVFGNTIYNLSGAISDIQASDELMGAFMTSASIGHGAAAIFLGLVLMLVSSFMPKSKVN